VKILFIGHQFHAKTLSNSFFLDTLKEFFDVTVALVDPADVDALTHTATSSDVDLVVLWQMDFLAPVFLARGLRTVVVPMYDGSEQMPDLHWLWAAGAGFVNFSRRLDERIRRLGLRTLRLKYFSRPAAQSERPAFDDLRVFLWQRRPEQGVNLHLVETLFGRQITHVHVHDVADDPTLDTARYLVPTLKSYELTTSRWLPSKADYRALMAKCNVYVTPRLTEGIGMGFLEAMGLGMLVVAADAPTHDEYIANWVNGILFNPDAPGEVPISPVVAQSLAESAWNTVRDGYQQWRSMLPKLIAFVQATPAPRAVEGIDLAALTHGLVRSYLAGLPAYTAYLLNRSELIMAMSGIDLRGRLGSDGALQPLKPKLPTAPWMARTSTPWLTQNRIDFADDDCAKYLIDSDVAIHEGAIRLDTRAVAIGFRLDVGLGAPTRLRLDAAEWDAQSPIVSATSDRQICVNLNGWTLGFVSFGIETKTLSLSIPPQVLQNENVLQLLINYDHVNAPGSVGLRRCVFE